MTQITTKQMVVHLDKVERKYLATIKEKRPEFDELSLSQFAHIFLKEKCFEVVAQDRKAFYEHCTRYLSYLYKHLAGSFRKLYDLLVGCFKSNLQHLDEGDRWSVKCNQPSVSKVKAMQYHSVK